MDDSEATAMNEVAMPDGSAYPSPKPRRKPVRVSHPSPVLASPRMRPSEAPPSSAAAEEPSKKAAKPARKKFSAAYQAEIDQLWKNYHANPGDETRNQLVEVYQDFVGSVTRRFATRLPRSVDRGDLVTAGSVGLMNAIVGFDPDRGVRFESYCELRVKGALLDELRTQDWLPRPWRQRMEQQKRTIEALRSREGREPSDEEVAQEMELSVDLYQQLFGVGLPGAPSGSMGANGSDEDAMLTLEVVPDSSATDPDEGLTREELLSLVTQRLTDQEYRILYLRYWEGLAMREIGEMTQLSESRVCKIHTRLIERLQERMHAFQEGE